MKVADHANWKGSSPAGRGGRESWSRSGGRRQTAGVSARQLEGKVDRDVSANEERRDVRVDQSEGRRGGLQ